MEDVLLSRGVVLWYEDWMWLSVRCGERDPSLALRMTNGRIQENTHRDSRGQEEVRSRGEMRSFAGAQDDKWENSGEHTQVDRMTL